MRPEHRWYWRCPACDYRASTLPPGVGADIPGLEALRRDNFTRMLDRLETVSPIRGKRVLEIGAARGWFLEAAAARGAEVLGVEPDQGNAAIAQATGLSVEIGLFPQVPHDQGPFDLVVFNDVFEHIPDPGACVPHIERLLAPGGLAVFNYPDSDGMMFRLAGVLASLGAGSLLDRLWQKDMPSPHVSYFNRRTLRTLVEKTSSLRWTDDFALTTVAASGLRERVFHTHRGPVGWVLYAGLLGLTAVLPHLPPDISVSVFRKPA